MLNHPTFCQALEAEEWELYDDIEQLEKKPTTRQLFGWLSSKSVASLRLTTVLLFPWRFLSAILRKVARTLREPLDGLRDSVLGDGGSEPPPALDAGA